MVAKAIPATTAEDWHPADVVAALHKRGTSLRRLSLANEYAPNTLKKALHLPWPKAEWLIARAIGMNPWALWPSRYEKHGSARRSHAAYNRQRAPQGKAYSAPRARGNATPRVRRAA